jgi:hypothetical protein
MHYAFYTSASPEGYLVAVEQRQVEVRCKHPIEQAMTLDGAALKQPIVLVLRRASLTDSPKNSFGALFRSCQEYEVDLTMWQ